MGEDRRRWWALSVIALGQLMVVFDVTIVNVALPSIGRALDLSAGDRHWVITAYTLAFAGLLLVGGRVADRIGRRRDFLIAVELADGRIVDRGTHDELLAAGGRYAALVRRDTHLASAA